MDRLHSKTALAPLYHHQSSLNSLALGTTAHMDLPEWLQQLKGRTGSTTMSSG
ncbi:hypothetical protein BC827DRAFT_1228547 [Russula dissimulans]|nr:hypothetical protein BC827DRAFT_1228547 [Russula dissimulans]